MDTESASKVLSARITSGAGGAARAFAHAGSRRVGEIEKVLGFVPFLGSLNLRCQGFPWGSPNRIKALVLDVVNRRAGLDSAWAPRPANFYPVRVRPAGSESEGVEAWAFRFDGEMYPEDFVELIAAVRLRDSLRSAAVEVLC